MKKFKTELLMERKPDYIVGILNTLTKNLEGTYGREKARELLYKAGFLEGKKVGKELGRASSDQAIRRLFSHMASHTECKVMNTITRTDRMEATVTFDRCVIRELLNSCGAPYPADVCRVTWGYIDGALSTMTRMRTKINLFRSTLSDKCVGTIHIISSQPFEEFGEAKPLAKEDLRVMYERDR